MPIVWVDTRERRRGCGAVVGPGDVSQNEVGVGQQRAIVSNELVVYVARSADRRLRPPVNVQPATSLNLTIDVAHERREQRLVSVHITDCRVQLVEAEVTLGNSNPTEHKIFRTASTKGTMDPEGSARNSCNSWPLYAR